MRALAVALLAVAPISAIAPSCSNERPIQTIYVGQTYPITFHAESGDTVNVIMDDNSDELTELIWCEDSGGTLARNPHTEILICFDVDF